ncbi:dihydrofolate reductase family protein [Actinomadura kijaniata]|uniref:dihydrofolate reductase family protein n=1 Tax=Actinomadura kijaniata TaxID=46161 RepID=UPI000837500E|nr:dihydrofolate reductase family protein [Actinomadura kijaniata]
MRRLIVTNIISLDGYHSGPGGDVMALPFHQGFDEYNAERLRAADTLLLGRTSFEGFKAYWPPVADTPGAPPVEREISRLNDAIDKVVVSDSLTPGQTAPWTNTEIVKRSAARDRVAELKRGPGRDILVFGSRTLWNDLLRAGLVDELHLMIGPALLGDGVRVLDGGPSVALHLLETRPLGSGQLILARYAPR